MSNDLEWALCMIWRYKQVLACYDSESNTWTIKGIVYTESEVIAYAEQAMAA